VLNPGQSYTYKQNRSFSAIGQYKFWACYQDVNGNWRSIANSKAVNPYYIYAKVIESLYTSKDPYLSKTTIKMGETITGGFTVFNGTTKTITLKKLTLAGRDPGGNNVDFPPVYNIVLNPGQSYTYKQNRSFSAIGQYKFWACYQDVNGNWRSITSLGDKNPYYIYAKVIN
jgi:uncharacterized protein YbdZ (MbtH family)